MLIVETGDARDEIHYRFDRGEHRGKRYRVEIEVCDSPICPCNDVEVTFFPLASPTAEPTATPPMVRLDVHTGALDRELTSKVDRKFAEAFIADLSEEDRRLLRSIFFREKKYLTENIDVTQLDVPFPEDEIEGESLLIPYKGIFLYDKIITITVRGKSFQVDDLYCLRSRCPCADVHLFVAAISDDGEPLRSPDDSLLETYLRFDLKRRKWHVEEEDEELGVPASELIAELRKAPDLVRIYKERRRTLRTLFQNYLKRIAKVEAVEESCVDETQPKVGRNDPCPCGSGKKYKKCCLDKDS